MSMELQSELPDSADIQRAQQHLSHRRKRLLYLQTITRFKRVINYRDLCYMFVV